MATVRKFQVVYDTFKEAEYGGRSYDTIVLNVHAPAADKNDALTERFHDELERVLDQLLKYITKIFIGNFNVKSRDRRYFQTNNWE
jgi:hypothetical protein